MRSFFIGTGIVVSLLGLIGVLVAPTQDRRSLLYKAWEHENHDIIKLPRIDSQASHEFLNFRVLALGTSRTWGAGLESRDLAYPTLLSPQAATNLAIRGGGPQIPSTCLSTMVGDAIYDVIILEFFFNADQHLLRLVRRLKHRFPDAIFIFLHIWSPHEFTIKGEQLSKIILRSLHDKFAPDAPDVYNHFSELMAPFQDSDIKYNDASSYADAFIKEAVKEVDGVLLTQQVDTKHPVQFLKTYVPLMFQTDGGHYSELGAY